MAGNAVLSLFGFGWVRSSQTPPPSRAATLAYTWRIPWPAWRTPPSSLLGSAF